MSLQTARSGQVSSRDRADATLRLLAGKQLFAIPLTEITEVLRPRPLTRVPLGPACLLGLANVRGTALPIVSLATLLGHSATVSSSPAARIVVLARASRIGLLVDAVDADAKQPADPLIDLDRRIAEAFTSMPACPRPMVEGGGPVAIAAPSAVASAAAAQALISLLLAGQEFALPLASVAGVRRMGWAAAAPPGSASGMLGMVTEGTAVLPLVSLRDLLGLPPAAAPDHQTRIVVTRSGAGSIGLVVDAVTGIHLVEPAAIDPVPPVLTRGAGEARIEAIGRLEEGRRLVSILAPARLFDDATLARLAVHASSLPAHQTARTAFPPPRDVRQQFVVFHLGHEQYGLPVATVAEIVRRPDTLSRVPRAPAFVDGVMNVRGRVVLVINQSRQFAGAQIGDAPRPARVLVVRLAQNDAADRLLGLAVDGVSDVLNIAISDIAPAPARAGHAALFDRVATLPPAPGQDRRVVLLVDPQVLLDRLEHDFRATLANVDIALRDGPA